MWWLNFIDSMSEFRITMETHTLVYLCACLQKGLTEEERSTLNMGGTLLQTWVQDWIKTKKAVKHQHSSLPVSWLLIQGDQLIILSPMTSLPWWRAPSKVESKWTLLSIGYFITAKRKTTNIVIKIYYFCYFRGQSLSWRRDSDGRGLLLWQQIVVHIWAD